MSAQKAASVRVEILDDDQGQHLDAVRLYAPSGTYLVSIERETYREETS